MPYYDLRCSKCGNTFNAKATISQRENRQIPCPQCGSFELEAVFASVNYTVKSSGCDVSSCPQSHRCHAGCCHG
ncbi:MAG: zinc ribbon domain-containing protein [Clostridiaceae bacterium]|nr:zinc ribbon domain-containing protein [Clostridiaceae bacterium]